MDWFLYDIDLRHERVSSKGISHIWNYECALVNVAKLNSIQDATCNSAN